MGAVIKMICAFLGGAAGLVFGDFNTILGVLAGAMVADYITGLLAAGSRSELSSKIGYKAIKRKLAMLVVVALAHGVDLLLNTGDMWRNLAAGFYIGNEGLSVFENCARMDVLVPEQIRAILQNIIEKQPDQKDK